MESDVPPNPYRIRRDAPVGGRPSPRPRSGGCAWIVVSFVLAGLLGITWLGILGTAGAGLAMTGNSLPNYWEEAVIEDNESDDRIVVIEVAGLISNIAIDTDGMTMVKSIRDQLAIAADDESVKGVILKIDSPGGEVLASDDIYREIQAFQSVSQKPVVASMSGLAASGGYYVAAPCRWIVANELTITGSIGVILHSYNYRGLMDKVGVRPQVFKSGRFKDMLSGDKALDEILPETQTMIQAMIDETFDRFKTVVREGRTEAESQNNGTGRALVENWEDFADGRIFSGKQAFELGFVDELGNFDQAVSRIETLVGSSEVDLIKYQLPFSFGNIFQIFGKAEASQIKVDLGIPFPQLQAGRLYFLSSTFFQ